MLNCMRQKLHREINESIITVRFLNTPVSEMDRSNRQEISKDSRAQLSDTDSQSSGCNWDLQMTSSNSRTHLLLKLTWSTHQERHVLGHKTHLNKFKTTEIIQCLLSEHNRIKLEINRKIAGKSKNTWEIKKHFWKKNTRIKEEISTEILKIFWILPNFLCINW